MALELTKSEQKFCYHFVDSPHWILELTEFGISCLDRSSNCGVGECRGDISLCAHAIGLRLCFACTSVAAVAASCSTDSSNSALLASILPKIFLSLGNKIGILNFRPHYLKFLPKYFVRIRQISFPQCVKSLLSSIISAFSHLKLLLCVHCFDFTRSTFLMQHHAQLTQS